MNLKFYVVFHHNLEDFYTDDIKNYFEFISVNDSIPKNIKNPNLNVSKESSIDGYKDYQSLRFNESSAILNLEITIKNSNIDYICFLQYDNMVNMEYINFIKNNIKKGNCICPWLMNSKEILESSLPNMFSFFNEIVQIFNTVYNTNYSINDIGGPMISTFVIHKDIYSEMIDFYKKSETYIVNPYINNYGTRHIAGFLERFWAIFINLRLKDNIIKNSDGFLSFTEVKDIQNQLWRYQN
jgi:hypothetical protein